MTPSLRQIEIFLAVAACGSIGRAATELRVAQPVVSRTVKALEDALGTRLLERAARGSHPTEAGRLLAVRGADLLRGFDELGAEVRRLAAEPRGRLAVGIPPSLSGLLAARVLPAFARAYPRVTLCVHEANSTELCDKLQAGALDLAVIASGEPAADVDREPLASEPYALVGPVDRPMPAGRGDAGEVRLADLFELPLILTSRPNILRRLIDERFARRGRAPLVVAEANSAIAVAMVEGGMGWTVLPASASWAAVGRGTVRAATVRGLGLTWTLARRRSRPVAAAGRLFGEALRGSVPGLQGLRPVQAGDRRSGPRS